MALFLRPRLARGFGSNAAQQGTWLPLGVVEGLGWKTGAGCCVKCNKEAGRSKLRLRCVYVCVSANESRAMRCGEGVASTSMSRFCSDLFRATTLSHPAEGGPAP